MGSVGRAGTSVSMMRKARRDYRTCISEKDSRRRVESLLNNIVENLHEPVETRIAYGTVKEYL